MLTGSNVVFQSTSIIKMRIGNFLKKAVNISRQKELPKLDIDALQNQLGVQFFNILESTFIDRKANVENSKLTSKQLERVAAKYVKQNMAIAMASGLVPGPMGIFAAIPELTLTMKNQMAMIYDFSCGYDKESFLNKDLLLDIPIFALGGKTNLSNLQNKANLIDSPSIILKEKAIGLGKGIVERNLKKSLVKFIPVGGALIMATWAKMSTQKISKVSKTFFDDNEQLEDKNTETPKKLKNQLVTEKIKAMINLMEANGNIHEEEIAFIAPVIAKAEIPDDQKAYLLQEAQTTGSQLSINFGLFDSYPEEAEIMMMELCILAKRDGIVHTAQKNYLMQIADKINYNQHELDGILSIRISS